MPSANVTPVSDQVWELMSPRMQEVSKECNALFNRVPAWDKGYPWRTPKPPLRIEPRLCPSTPSYQVLQDPQTKTLKLQGPNLQAPSLATTWPRNTLPDRLRPAGMFSFLSGRRSMRHRTAGTPGPFGRPRTCSKSHPRKDAGRSHFPRSRRSYRHQTAYRSPPPRRDLA